MQTTNFIPTNKALLDSLSLKIPFSDCVILDERLTSMTCIYYESLNEVDCELHPPKPLLIEQTGITVRMGLVEIPIYDATTKEKTLTKFINLTLSAKLLKEFYFEGITLENVYTLYVEFMGFLVFECDFDTFINGVVSDIDICVNRYTNSPAEFEQILKEYVLQTGSKSKYANLISKDFNLGLSMNTRNFAKPSLPFIKFYFKFWELLSKSKLFFDTYLSDYKKQIENLSRVEVTIKNYAHKQRLIKYGIIREFKTLKELLYIPSEELLEVVKFSVTAYTEKQLRVKSEGLSPNDYIIFELLQNCVMRGFDFKAIMQIAENYNEGKGKSKEVAKSRIRTKLKQSYDMFLHSERVMQQATINKNVLEYLRNFGVK